MFEFFFEIFKRSMNHYTRFFFSLLGINNIVLTPGLSFSQHLLNSILSCVKKTWSGVRPVKRAKNWEFEKGQLYQGSMTLSGHI
jgi:hypothetical protein